MKNVILSMLAKISKIDSQYKQLTARVEAQSLLISALVLAVSRQGGVTEMMESASKAINTIIESVDTEEVLKSDAAILLNELQELLLMARTVDGAEADLNHDGLADITGIQASVETQIRHDD